MSVHIYRLCINVIVLRLPSDIDVKPIMQHLFVSITIITFVFQFSEVVPPFHARFGVELIDC